MYLEIIEHLCYNQRADKTGLLQKNKRIKHVSTERGFTMITIHKNRSAFLPQADRFIGFENDHLVEERLFCVEDEALRDYIFKLDIAESADIVDLSRVSDTTDAVVLRWNITSGGSARAER